jgi:hypothetical protein
MMMQTVRKSRNWKVNGYVRAVLALDAIRRKGEERYDGSSGALDLKRNALARGCNAPACAERWAAHRRPAVACRHCRRVGTRRELASAVVRRQHLHTHAI